MSAVSQSNIQTSQKSESSDGTHSDSKRPASLAYWRCPVIDSRSLVAEAVSEVRAGMIQSDASGETLVFGRHWPHWGSQLGVWIDQRFPRLPDDTCRLFFSRPRNCPGFIAFNYGVSGPQTHLRTCIHALQALHRIADLIDARAIVCHASNSRLSDKVMGRWGYERHAKHLAGRHFIKRFAEKPSIHEPIALAHPDRLCH
jgi:hypothetical protein